MKQEFQYLIKLQFFLTIEKYSAIYYVAIAIAALLWFSWMQNLFKVYELLVLSVRWSVLALVRFR